MFESVYRRARATRNNKPSNSAVGVAGGGGTAAASGDVVGIQRQHGGDSSPATALPATVKNGGIATARALDKGAPEDHTTRRSCEQQHAPLVVLVSATKASSASEASPQPQSRRIPLRKARRNRKGAGSGILVGLCLSCFMVKLQLNWLNRARTTSNSHSASRGAAGTSSSPLKMLSNFASAAAGAASPSRGGVLHQFHDGGNIGGSIKRYTISGSSFSSANQHPIRTLDNADTYPSTSSCPAGIEDDASIRTTLVLQCSLNRVYKLEEHCKRYKDPIVAVVTVTDEERRRAAADSDGDAVAKELKDWVGGVHCPQMTLIEYRVDDDQQSQPENYPVNLLRNVGLDYAATSHVLLADVDFIPSMNLQDTIRATLKERRELRRKLANDGDGSGGAQSLPAEDNEAIVVPAFERKVPCQPKSWCRCATEHECMQLLRENETFIPRTFDELNSCVKAKPTQQCIVFRSYIKLASHSTTKSREWMHRRYGKNCCVIMLHHLRSVSPNSKSILTNHVYLQ